MMEAPASSFLSVALKATISATLHTHITVSVFYWQSNCPSSHCCTPYGPMASGAICASFLCSLAPARLWLGCVGIFEGFPNPRWENTFFCETEVYLLVMVGKVHKNKWRADWSSEETSTFFGIQLANFVKMLKEPSRRCNVELVRDTDVHPHCTSLFLLGSR